MFQPQPMPPMGQPPQKPFDPWAEKAEMDPNDPWRPGEDMNAAPGNAPAIAIPGAGNPPAMGGGMAAGGGGPMMKPQPMPPMGAGGSMGGPMPGGMPHAGMGGMLRQLLMRKMQGGQ